MKYLTVRQNPSSEYPPSVRRQWICGFHSRGRPKVWRTQIKPGTKFLDLFREKKSSLMTSETDSKRQLRRSRSSRKNWRRESSIVKTRCLWVQLMSLKDIEVDLSLEYLAPQVGQNLEWQRKGTNLKLPQWGQPYMAPPKEGSPHPMTLSMFSMTTGLGFRSYSMIS